MIADTIHNVTEDYEITPHVIRTTRTRSLSQVVNTTLRGFTHVQNIGVVTYQLTVEFVLYHDRDVALETAWMCGDLIKVVDDQKIYYGYITKLSLSDEYVDGYHKGTLVIQEEADV